MKAERGFVQVHGAGLAYELSGGGPPLVLIHGFTLDQRVWDEQVPVLAERYRVLRYDMRGFGRSDPPTPGVPYTHADDLLALMHSLGLAKAAVLGFSLGGWVALEFTLIHPAAVSKLILVDAALREYRYSPAASREIELIYRLGSEGKLAEAKTAWLANPMFVVTNRHAGGRKRLAEIVADYSGWHLQHDDPHPPLETAALHRLPEVDAPTLVVVGEHDIPDFHDIARLLVAQIPNAHRVVIRDAGHMVGLDNPSALTQAVIDFLG